MREMGFQDLRSGFRARDISPDSVIFTTGESNLSLFSSASASVERCSSASDVPADHDYLASQLSQHLAGHEFAGALGGPDPDPNKLKAVHNHSVCISRREKAKDIASSETDTTEDENLAIDSARNSFSRALKECQDRKSRSEALLKKADRRRPASLDLNNSAISVTNSASPRFGIMKKLSTTTCRTGTFPSPGTPNYRNTIVGIQKGWSSERVPLQTSANRKSLNTALFPGNGGKTLPSKWEDAERWIFSPVSGDGAMRTSFQQTQRRPKSKSGPLVPPGAAYYQLYSPAAPMFEAGNSGKLIANSPFSAGIMAADGLSIQYGGSGAGGSFSLGTEPCMARSVSLHGCTEMVCQSSLIGYQDEKYVSTRDSANNISHAVSRRDMATQMSPTSSSNSSLGRRSSFSLMAPSILPILEAQSVHSSKAETRDVQVDERVTMTRWSKKHRTQIPGRGCGNVDDWKRKALEIRSASWEVSDTTNTVSKVKREEAKITAWENLQKAKAEAAIRKLEMKLEKKRASSMDKIMNKLRSAQKKAQEMRSKVTANQHHQIARIPHKAISFRRTRHISSLSGCFTCHAF